LLIGAGLLWASAARTEGPFTQIREVSPFQEIELRGKLTAEIVRGESFSLTLEGVPESVKKTTSEVNGGRLVVVAAPGGFGRRNIHAVVTLPELKDVAVLNAAQAWLKGFAGPHLKIALDGAATVTAQGIFNSYDLSASGASTARLGQLEARVAYIRIDLASKAQIAPLDGLRGSVSNASHVIYHGDRSTVNVDVDIASRLEYRSGK
ncbi:MAG: DUF2807 domain-containing protein, partial [Deltaproteobacteria bacterium]|nr:DUF2807 domain-containing protein [Deltaproteobacteria bacterium]